MIIEIDHKALFKIIDCIENPKIREGLKLKISEELNEQIINNQTETDGE